MSRLNTSADKRRAAISNVVRVRVLFSKNRLNTLLPRNSGTLFTSRSAMLMKAVGGVQDALDDLARQPFDREQMMQLAFAVELRIAAAIQHRAPLSSDAGGHHRRASERR